MLNALVFVLLFLALVIGFVLGGWHVRRKNSKACFSTLSWPQQRYYAGLTQLLNDEPDAAIDTFIAALEVNSDTLETHLALGNLLRRRGEVSRAIRIHQNLLSRPGLNLNQMHFVQLELAVDYLKAGLLDRAESIFKELVDLPNVKNEIRQQATEHLLDVYMELREWLLAIDTADRLTARKFSGSADEWRKKQAQFSCELAEVSLEKEDWLSARRWLRSALRYDKNCARASLLLTQLEFALGDYELALAALNKVQQQDNRFTVEILAPMFECYKKIDNLPEYHNQILALYELKPELMVLRYLAKAKEAVEGGDAVVSLLMQELQHFPEMEPAGELLKLVADERGPTSLRNYVRVKGVLEKLTESRQKYLCNHCGFHGNQIHWLCPSCKSWATISLVPE